MRGTRWLAIMSPGLGSGCRLPDRRYHPDGDRRSRQSRPWLIRREPVAEKTIETAPVKTVTFADRHPLFTKPRQYWETSGDNKIVKAAAATFIGVPAGVVGEVKQIFVGAPPETRF